MLLHVLPLVNEHGPTSSPWTNLRGRRHQPRPQILAPNRDRIGHRRKFRRKTETDGPSSQDGDDEASLKSNNGSSSGTIVRQRSINECYFVVKGAALVLPKNDSVHYRKSSTHGGDMQKHLKSMFYLLRQEDTLKMAVKLESVHVGRTRYLVVVSCMGRQNMEESCLLGVDCNDRTTIGLVLPVWADTRITLDGDGGFSLSTNHRHHIFKPVSVQTMWSALQVIHKASAKAREYNYFMGGVTHSWIEYYDQKIESDRSCLNEWFAMDNLESRRPPSPDCYRLRPKEREVTEKHIREKLKEIMMTVDLDEVTSKYIRTRLEEALDMDLNDYKSFIDQEMITILGQMDKATKIFDFLYLGSEWNASNLEELQKNGVGHILNVTQEIDNFFPGMFDYMNIRVYDDEGTELLRHWDSTFKFIDGARHKGSKVLVHCKMGVSRSASVVIAYAMKAYNLNMQDAHKLVKSRRHCIKPNTGFMRQLETYQGILLASKHRNNLLWRSKSENNLKCPVSEEQSATEGVRQPEEPMDADHAKYLDPPAPGSRPKSWSPDDNVANTLFPVANSDAPDGSANTSEREQASTEDLMNSEHTSKFQVLMRSEDSKSYSVSPNKALHLPLPSEQLQPSTDGSVDGEEAHVVQFQIGDDDWPPMSDMQTSNETSAQAMEDDGSGGGLVEPVPHNGLTVHRVSSIKDRINELESHANSSSEPKPVPVRRQADLPENTGLVSNLTNQFECVSKSTPSSPTEENAQPLLAPVPQPEIQGNGPVVSQTKPPAPRHQAVLVRPETWNDVIEIVPPPAAAALPIPPSAAVPPLLPLPPSAVLPPPPPPPSAVLPPPPPPSAAPAPNEVIMRVLVNNQLKQIVGSQPVSVLYGEVALAHSSTVENATLKPCLEGQSPPVTSKQHDPFSAQVDCVFDCEERSRQVRADSWSSSDGHLGQLANSLNMKRTPSPRKGAEAPFWTAAVPEECILKRTSSFDGSLTLHHSAPSGADGTSILVASSSAFPPGNVIQRSQSLRTSTSSSRGCGTGTCLPDYRLHSPRPYTGPGERKAVVERPPCAWSPAVTVVDGTESSVHYASAPTLFRSNPLECRPAGPLHSASQPNITYPTAVQQQPQQPSKSRSELRLDLDAGRSAPMAPADKVPCSGIVKQQRKAIESRSAPVIGAHQLPASSSDRKPLSPEEWKRLQYDLQKVPAVTTRVPQKVTAVVTPPITIVPPSTATATNTTSVSSLPDNSEDGLVKRMTREMEAKVIVPGLSPPVALTPLEPDGPLTDKLIILDQFGKEVQPRVCPGGCAVTTPDCTSAEMGPRAAVVVLATRSPQEEKSVRSLVDKFEVKEQPSPRQRYHSETEVTERLCSSAPVQGFLPFGEEATKSTTSGKKLRRKDASGKPPSSSADQPHVTTSSSRWNFANFGLSRNRPPAVASKTSSESGPAGGQQLASDTQAPRKFRKMQGKSHPLTRLQNQQQRHPSPLYNTM